MKTPSLISFSFVQNVNIYYSLFSLRLFAEILLKPSNIFGIHIQGFTCNFFSWLKIVKSWKIYTKHDLYYLCKLKRSFNNNDETSFYYISRIKRKNITESQCTSITWRNVVRDEHNKPCISWASKEKNWPWIFLFHFLILLSEFSSISTGHFNDIYINKIDFTACEHSIR